MQKVFDRSPPHSNQAGQGHGGREAYSFNLDFLLVQFVSPIQPIQSEDTQPSSLKCVIALQIDALICRPDDLS